MKLIEQCPIGIRRYHSISIALLQMTQIFSKNLFRQFSIFIKYFGKNFENKKQKMSQLCGFIKDKKEDLLEKYLISLRPSGIVTVEQLEEYKEAQRDLTDHMNVRNYFNFYNLNNILKKIKNNFS